MDMKIVEINRIKEYNNDIKYTIGGKRMDRITQSMVDAFQKDLNLNFEDSTQMFEYFSNYCVVNNVYGINDFDLDEITTGKSTQGIDGIAIIVNQKLINTIEDIDLLISLNQTISVKFVLIQTKTSTSFDNTEISNLFTFSRFYFSEDTSLFHNREMQKFIELKDYIFKYGNKLKKIQSFYYIMLH